MQDIYKNIEEYNIGKKHKELIVFEDMIVDMINNKKLNPIVTELFIRGSKWSISFLLLQNHILKCLALNSTLFLLWKFLIKENSNKLH